MLPGFSTSDLLRDAHEEERCSRLVDCFAHGIGGKGGVASVRELALDARVVSSEWTRRHMTGGKVVCAWVDSAVGS